MNPNLTKHRKNIAVLGLLIAVAMTGLLGRLGFLMLVPGRITMVRWPGIFMKESVPSRRPEDGFWMQGEM